MISEIQRRSDVAGIELREFDSINDRSKVMKKKLFLFNLTLTRIFFSQIVQIITPEQNGVTSSVEMTSKKPDSS